MTKLSHIVQKMLRSSCCILLMLPTGLAMATNLEDESAKKHIIERLSDPELHCGITPPTDVLEGIVRALSEPTEFETSTFAAPFALQGKKLQLLMHFPEGATEIPSDCAKKLKSLASQTKKQKIRGILIRSSLNDEHTTEFDLALASERLENIKTLMRNERLARKAMVLELHPSTSNPMIAEGFYTPRIIEVYSNSD